MTPDEMIGKMHRACTQIRLAIARLEKEVPEDEASPQRIDEAMRILTEVREEMAK